MAEITYGVYQRPKVGYAVSGDAYLIKENNEDVLVCLVDGLGAGPAAAEAAQVAVSWVADHCQASLSQLVLGCHEALRTTRGAALALVRINTTCRELVFMGVGNIECHARSAAPIKPISYAGIVGSRLPSLREFHFSLTPGDVIVLHTDGVSRRFSLDNVMERQDGVTPQCLAETIADGYAKRNDDATLIVLSFSSRTCHVEETYDKDTDR